MTAVARGAAIYASTLPMKVGAKDTDNEDILQLDIDFEATCVDTETYVIVHTKNVINGLSMRLIRTADGRESETTEIDHNGGLLTAGLLPGKANTFIIAATVNGVDTPCFPSEFTVIQGTKTGSAILPYNIGIEVYNPRKNRRMFTMTGLEKNRPLPAHGTVYGLKTMADILPGDRKSKFRIAVYQGDADAEGKTAILCEYMADVVITSDDLASYIPEGTHVNVRIDVDRSEMMKVICEFPASSQKVEKKLDTTKRQAAKREEYLKELISDAYSRLRALTDALDDDSLVMNLRLRLMLVEESMSHGAQRKQVEHHIKRGTAVYRAI